MSMMAKVYADLIRKGKKTVKGRSQKFAEGSQGAAGG